ncbi:MAG: TetR/AcrR family transcriptional regulator [Bacilli bacterium]|nr:TetR/AcrR family transcriptional regulator [Bacilli bacterium]
MAINNLIDKTIIINSAVAMVKKNGWESLNARSLAQEIGISTKPLYRLYTGMDEIKEDIYNEVYKQYDEFINKRVYNKNALVTLCVAYVEFANEYKNLFKCLFLSNNLQWKSIDDVLNEKWNQSTIISLVNKFGYSFEDAKNLFMHVWLYANGLATLVATNDLKIDSKDIIKRIIKIYKEVAK